MKDSLIMNVLRTFRWAILTSFVVLAAVAVFTQSWELFSVTLLLAALELGLSFDNAVVNALTRSQYNQHIVSRAI